MSDGEAEAQTAKRHRWEGLPGDEGPAATSLPPPPLPTRTRWSAMTPRASGADPTRVLTGFAAEHSTWRGLATPTATPYAADTVPTPRFGGATTPRLGGATPLMQGMGTPAMGGAAATGMGMGVGVGLAGGATPTFPGGATPAAPGLAFAATPNYQFEGTTPRQSHFAGPMEEGHGHAQAAAIEAHATRLEREWRRKNRRLTAEYLDRVLPAEDFVVVPVPATYNPLPPEEPNFYVLAREAMHAEALAAGLAGKPAAGDVEGAASGGAAEPPVVYDIPESLGEGMPAMRPEDAAVFVELLKYHNVDPIPDESLPSYLLMKNLFKIMNGDANQRRSGTNFLLEKSRLLGINFILQRMFSIWSANIMGLRETHNFIDFIKALISHLGTNVRGSTKEVIHLMEPLLSAQEPITREDGKQVLLLLTRVVGYKAMFDAIKVDFAHEESIVRRHTANVAALIGFAVGVEQLLPALQDLSYAPTALARQTVARVLGEVAGLVGHGLLGSLPEIVSILERLIRDEKRVRNDAALAVASLAEAVAPYGIQDLAPVVEVITDVCRKGMGISTAPYLKAFGALVPLMAPYDAEARTSAMMPTLVNQFNTPEAEYRRVLLQVVRNCVSADGVTAAFIREVILEPFFEGFWQVRQVAADRKTSTILIETTVQLAKKLGSVDILLKLVRDMKDENEHYQRMVITAVRCVVETAGTAAAEESLVAFLLDGAIAAVRQDEIGTNRVVSAGLAAVCNSLGARLRPYLKQLFDLINRRRESREPPVRAQAAGLIASIAHAVVLAEGTIFLQDVGRSLYERLEDDNAHALSANLRATRALLHELGSRSYKPSVRELLKKLTFVIKNRYNIVQQNAIALIEDIATHHEDDVEAIHLYELATKGLFELLDAERRETRRACTRTFGIIARVIRPFAIILELVDQLSQDKRKIRVCTAVALASIAKECGPFTVIPYLLNEFKLSEGKQVAVIVQHAILKAFRYIFQSIGSTGKDYVYALIPLLERSLTETSIQMRRMAVEACQAVVLSIAGQDDFEAVAIHFLNFIHPNIVELLSKNETQISGERLKMVTAVVSYYEAARLVLGPGRLLQYLLQGLFHPAKKVRDIYRRTYNMVYIGSPEGLVPYYPRVSHDESHTFERHELEILV